MLHAVVTGKTNIVEYAVRSGISPDYATKGGTALVLAAIEGYASVVKTLLKHGADVDGTDDIGRTPLVIAALEGHVDVAKELLDYGANVEVTDDRRMNPLEIAIMGRHEDVVTVLLRHGVRVTGKMCPSTGRSSFAPIGS